MGDPKSPNNYLYTGSNPVNSSDPSGANGFSDFFTKDVPNFVDDNGGTILKGLGVGLAAASIPLTGGASAVVGGLGIGAGIAGGIDDGNSPGQIAAGGVLGTLGLSLGGGIGELFGTAAGSGTNAVFDGIGACFTYCD